MTTTPELIVACCPVDKSKLPTLPPGNTPIPEPSILHTITGCVACGCEVWIGPRQKATGLPPHCYLCAISIFEVVGSWMTVALNPDEDQVPRRRNMGT